MSEYLIFSCTKCSQFSYVKTSQKTKKCLRCGKNHLVKNLVVSGIVVNGITKALEVVKEKQNELGLKNSKDGINFRSENDFIVKAKIKKENYNKSNNLHYEDLFKKILIEVKNSQIYNAKKGIPEYYIDMILKDNNIPFEKVRVLKREFLKKNALKLLKNCFLINL